MKKMHTLTVNGNAYQVSDPEAVSFAAAQTLTEEQKAQAKQNLGMGGQYQLIEDITLSEDVTRFSRKADPEGVAYDFSAIRVLMYAPAYAGATSADQVIFSLSSPKTASMVYHQASNAVATNAKRTILSARNQNGFVDYLVTVANGGNVGTVGLRPAILVEPWQNISTLNMVTNPSSQVIPAGTRIVIYAVRG